VNRQPLPVHDPINAGRLGSGGALSLVAGRVYAPASDVLRSPVARRIAELADRRGLFLFDYEARLQLELPEHWLPVSRPDLGVTGEPPSWHRGLLGESKYLSFRHDLLIGSLHPGHRAKWSAHELCHGLVGFAWRTDASALFHALAARLAEVLPVAVWYFFDESGLSRCPRHAHQTEVGPGFCRACEDAQGLGPRELTDADRDFALRGKAFLTSELAAIRKAIADGAPVYSPHGAIDLMTDGINYAAANLARLRSPETSSFMAHFFPTPGRGRFDSLEAMLAHVEALGHHLAAVALGESPDFARLASDDLMTALVPALPQAVHIAQDLGSRLLQVAADADGQCHAELLSLVARLGEASVSVTSGQGDLETDLEARIATTVESYIELFEDWELPPAEEVFATGYRLPIVAHNLSGLEGFGEIGDLADLGLSRQSLLDGLASACPASTERLQLADRLNKLLDSFLIDRPPSRRPLSRRFLDHLRSLPGGAATDLETLGLFALETAITDAEPPDPGELTLGFDAVDLEPEDTLTLAKGVELVRCGFDAGGLLMSGQASPTGPHDFLVRRDAGDQVGLVALTSALASRIEAGPLPAIAVLEGTGQSPELLALVEECLVVPRRHALLTDA